MSNYVETCRHCKGTGYIRTGPETESGESCDTCHGTGKVDIEKDIKIKVKPHITQTV